MDYTTAVDMWSIGCIFGELLGRRILFQAISPIQQLELITDLLGTPSLSDMRFACDAAKRHMLSRGQKPASITALYTLSNAATHEAVHLLCQMLTLDPEKRIGVVEALNHPYLGEGPDLRQQGQGQAAPLHPGPDQLQPGAPLHQ